MLVSTGLAAATFLALSLLFAVFRVRRTSFHRVTGLLGLLATVVHVAHALDTVPTRLTPGLVAVCALLLLCVAAAGSAPRRYAAATQRARLRRARSPRRRFALPWRVLHWTLALVAVGAAAWHIAGLPVTQPAAAQQAAWLIAGEGIAVAIVGRYALPILFPRRSRTPPRHLRTPDVDTHRHSTGAVLRTAPVPVRPEKVLTTSLRVVVTTCDALPLALTHSPDVVLVSVSDHNALLHHRRALSLCGGGAHYFRNARELVTSLPEGRSRAVSLYHLVGGEDFTSEIFTRLTTAGVPHDRIRVDTTDGHPTLPDEHPSARIRPIRDHQNAHLAFSTRQA